MTLYIKDTDIRIGGTLECLDGTAALVGLNDDGTLLYAGSVSIHEDSVETVFGGAYPVWIAAGDHYEEFHGVEVEDRKEDGTIIPYKGLSDIDAAEDELIDLLNLVVEKAGVVLAKTNLSASILNSAMNVQLLSNHAAVALERAIKDHRG